jgi:uncharacterized protein YjbI with pentapeptide repeats
MTRITVKSKGKVANADRSDVVLRDARYEGADFARQSPESFEAISCTFIRCDFRYWTVRDMCFASGPKPSLYQDCTFDGSRLSVTSVGVARFERCSFRDVDIRGLLGPAAEYIECVFTGVLRSAVFTGRIVTDIYAGVGRQLNEFRGNDFSGASLRDVSFIGGIDLAQQRLPQGNHYMRIPDAARRLAAARSIVSQWTDANERRAILIMLDALKVDVDTGQQELFISKDTLGHLDRQLLDKALRLLTA